MDLTNEVLAYAKTTIKFTARKLIGKCSITRDDLKDIESEMMLDVLIRLSKHDNEKWSYKTFITHVVKNKAHHILRNRCTQKEYFFRNARSMDTLRKVNKNDRWFTLHDIVSVDSLHGKNEINEFEYCGLCNDLESVISNLNAIQQKCCLGIMNNIPIYKIAKDNNIPQSTFYKHVITPIRKAFKKAGLQEYLK